MQGCEVVVLQIAECIVVTGIASAMKLLDDLRNSGYAYVVVAVPLNFFLAVLTSCPMREM